jgi:hypothetical protein
MKSDKAKEFLVTPISRDIQGSRQRMNEIVDEAVFHIREEAFDDAEQWLRTQLLRWCDPKEELPEEGVPVLVKFQNGAYDVLLRYTHPSLGQGWTPDNVGILTDDSLIIGWRPILE